MSFWDIKNIQYGLGKNDILDSLLEKARNPQKKPAPPAPPAAKVNKDRERDLLDKLLKNQGAKPPVAKLPVAKLPVAKSPVAKSPVAKPPVARKPVVSDRTRTEMLEKK